LTEHGIVLVRPLEQNVMSQIKAIPGASADQWIPTAVETAGRVWDEGDVPVDGQARVESKGGKREYQFILFQRANELTNI
jgi:hypothetical protein